MKTFRRWRIEIVMLAFVLLFGRQAWADDDQIKVLAQWCSDSPIFSYDAEINLCGGIPEDCYACIVWAP